MKKTRPQRASANETRDKILNAALALFIQKGFAGTSMGKLAEMAGVNQSLIFHHFGDKQRLWQQVKTSLIESTSPIPINSHPKNLHDFLSEVIQQRLSLYEKHPELIRLISWQRLEPVKRSQKLGWTPGTAFSPEKWLAPIQYLQQLDQINPLLSPELITTWIITSINGLIMDDFGIFKDNPKNYKSYITLILEGLSKALT